MIKNYLKIAFRSFLHGRLYSLVNIFGLTLGITATLLIVLYVIDETSYDRFHDDASLIHRVSFHAKVGDQNINTTLTGLPLAGALQEEASGVQSVIRLDKWMTCPLRYEDRAFTEMNLYLADSNFFSFFNFELLVGNPQEVLKGKGRMVISESVAVRYFSYKGKGDMSPIGKTMMIGSTNDVTAVVTGIIKDPPHNSHFHPEIIMSLETSGYADNTYWVNTEVYTYVKLFPGTDPAGIQRTIDGFITKYCAREIEENMKVPLKEFLGNNGFLGFRTQPLTDIHLHSDLGDEFEPNGNIEYVYLFSIVAVFILLLACINFMNLSTARSTLRAKEIGVRKAIGAGRKSLALQFLLETFMYSLASLAAGLLIAALLIEPFNDLAAKQLSLHALLTPGFLLSALALLVLVTVIAGTYPTFYLTAFNPITALKGKTKSGGGSLIRNGLVVFQFAISIFLIVASLSIYHQLSYLQQQSLGFTKQDVVGLMHTMNLGVNAGAFKNEIESHTEFVAASYSNRLPPDLDWFGTFVTEQSSVNQLAAMYMADHDHQKVMGFIMAEGRYFSRDFPSDTLAVIMNESAIRQFGLSDWQGKKIRFAGDGNSPDFHIIGVVKNFNYLSLKSSIQPMVMMLEEGANWDIAVRLAPGNTADKIALLKEIWKKYLPDAPFEYSFVSDNFDRKFASEARMKKVMIIFTGLTVFIACLGLFGLSTFTLARKSREIGIRKIHGASSLQILYLLSRSYMLLIMVAFFVASFASWFAVNKWLEGFAYRIQFSFLLTFIAGIVSILIALFVVGHQTLRAAATNPVQALRAD
ncbi:MAG TPA: ABC transporter permease [Chryseosolibacter sp.]|nr:ABC transporter permease [Chryseosolibacter sp.]